MIDFEPGLAEAEPTVLITVAVAKAASFCSSSLTLS
jgi:hypothetical protein